MQTETARLNLRPFTPADFDDLYGLYSDADVMRFLGSGVRSRQETEASLARMIAHWPAVGFGMWAVHNKLDGRFVGRCGLQPLMDTKEVELGYAFHRAYWRQGLATEAARLSIRFGFDTVGLERIVAIARPANIGSWRVMVKIGMTYERNGPSPYDQTEVVWYGLSRAGYRQNTQGATGGTLSHS
jgi:RimJ/RimL family protein N-acetyltransferase